MASVCRLVARVVAARFVARVVATPFAAGSTTAPARALPVPIAAARVRAVAAAVKLDIAILCPAIRARFRTRGPRLAGLNDELPRNSIEDLWMMKPPRMVRRQPRAHESRKLALARGLRAALAFPCALPQPRPPLSIDSHRFPRLTATSLVNGYLSVRPRLPKHMQLASFVILTLSDCLLDWHAEGVLQCKWLQALARH